MQKQSEYQNQYMDTVEDLQQFIDDNLQTNSKILEAGCGSISNVNFKGDNYFIGIDISEKQLDRNTVIQEKILADIQTHEFECQSLDVIVCWYVLEHIDQPVLALKNFVNALKSHGMLIIALPNVFSVKGLVTKYTPLWFHVFYYRHILGVKDAGKEDTAPFETFLKLQISPDSMKKFAANSGLEVAFFEQYDVEAVQGLRINYPILFQVYKGLSGFLKMLTFGKLGGADNSDYVMVLKKA